MSFLNSVRRIISRKDSQARVLISSQTMTPYVPMPKDYKGFAQEGYQRNVIAYRAIAGISEACAGVPWRLYQKPRGSGGKKTEITDHDLLNLLARPNPLQAQSSFIESVIAFRLISGNSYIEAVGPQKGSMAKVTELWTLRPDRMTIKPGARGYPAAYLYKVGNGTTEYVVDQVTLKSPILHLKTFNPLNDWYGMSPIEAAAYGIDQHNEANRWNAALLQNSARPSGAFVASAGNNSSGNLTDIQVNRIKSEIKEKYSNPDNAGNPMLLVGGLDWKSISMTPAEMDWLEGKNTSARDVALAFGYPPFLLGIPGDATYANYSEARTALYEETALPALDKLGGEFNHWLTPNFGDRLVLEYDKDEIHALAPQRQAIWDKVSSANFLTINEKRESTSFEPYEGGDVILVPSTQIPLEDAIEDPEPAPGPAKPAPDPAAADPSSEEDDPDEDDTDPANPPKKPGKSATPLFEIKIFNLTNDQAKQTEARGQLRLRGRLQKRLMRQSQATFEIEGHKVADVIRDLDFQHAEIAAAREIDANRSHWKYLLANNLRATSQAFSSRVFDSMKSIPGALERKASENEYDTFMQEWIETHVGDAITGIAETTKKQVIQAIRDAQEEWYAGGQPILDLSAKVQEAYDGFSESRSLTIARTETGIAANTSLLQAAKNTGITKLEKEWVYTNDSRTRDDHKLADPIVGIDEDFDVGGNPMAQPMDPRGPADEVINCRCAVVFKRAESDEEDSE